MRLALKHAGAILATLRGSCRELETKHIMCIALNLQAIMHWEHAAMAWRGVVQYQRRSIAKTQGAHHVGVGDVQVMLCEGGGLALADLRACLFRLPHAPATPSFRA